MFNVYIRDKTEKSWNCDNDVKNYAYLILVKISCYITTTNYLSSAIALQKLQLPDSWNSNFSDYYGDLLDDEYPTSKIYN